VPVLDENRVAAGWPLHEALRCARHTLINRVAALQFLGATMPAPPQGTAALASNPSYFLSMPAIIAIPDFCRPDDGVFRFRGS
jgi:hypothetical protein